jgi:hypothetical protein
MECKLRCVSFRRVSNPRRAFLPAFRVTGISENRYRCTMGVIVIGLGTALNGGKNFVYINKHLGVPATNLGTP